MEYRNLGRTGLKVSELCLGTMQFGWTADEATSLEVLTAAFEAGVNFLDTADVYSRWAEGNPGGVAEAIIGKWLKQEPGRRERTVIATKVRGRMGEGPNDEGLSRRHILDAAHASLRRLGIDAIDLYQVHWPDEGTPIDETLTALDDLVRWGDVRYIGCSNFPAWRLVEALGTSDRLGLARFVCLQPHYNLVHRDEYERELEAACLAYGLGVIPYAPLAAGYLTGKYRRGVPLPVGSRGAGSRRIQALLEGERGERVLRVLEKLGGQRGLSISQMALAWLLTRPSVTSPIIGPRSIGQLRDNLGAAGLRLEPRENHELDEVSNWRSEAED